MIKSTIDFKTITFPNGETRIDLGYISDCRQTHDFEWEFKGNADVMELLLFVDALKRSGLKVGTLRIEYFPYSRQDRNDPENSSFSLQLMANLINNLNATSVVIHDPHSDVTPALLNNCRVIPQHRFLSMWVDQKQKHFIVSPDAGASKKTIKMVTENTVAMIQCTKERNIHTGEITGTKLSQQVDMMGLDCYIVDDICDGGKTFIEIAKELKKHNPGKIVLLVTHGFFTKGFSVFKGLIDQIYTKEGLVWEDKSKEFTKEELIKFQKENDYKLTCDMVDYALMCVKAGDNEIKEILKESFEKASPMWRQSHYDLKDLK